MVVEKSAGQRRVEGVLYFLVPPLAAGLCRAAFGPGLWQIPVIVLAFAVMSLAGTALALRFGGVLMTPLERWRRSLMRIAAAPLWSNSLGLFGFYLVLLLSITLPMLGDAPPRGTVIVTLAISTLGAFLMAWLSLAYLLRQAAQLAAREPARSTPQNPWIWLRTTAPYRLITLACIVGGYVAAAQLSGPYRVVLLLAATWLGLVAESLVKARRSAADPVLWHNFSFAAALGAGAAINGSTFALFFGLAARLGFQGDDAVAWFFALVGLAAGVLAALVPWALARLNSFKGKA